jgi:hypothetical protein
MWRLLASLLLITGCSLYESESRKFLEKQAFEYAGTAAQANLVSCQNASYSDEWQFAGFSGRTDTYVRRDDAMVVQMVPRTRRELSCIFRFQSRDEFNDKFADAEALTEQHLGLGPDGFAFPSESLVK